MLLTYRGLFYQRNSSEIKTSETNRFATYRGIPYCIHRSVINQNNQSRKILKYRGISYSTN
jgi:hypothetical protein